MKAKHLTYSQAWTLCSECQFLKGHAQNDQLPVEVILVAPYSRILQWHYVHNLLKGQHPDALLQGYPGDRYDVILLIKDAGSPNGYAIRPLREYLRACGIPFSLRKGVSYKTAPSAG